MNLSTLLARIPSPAFFPSVSLVSLLSIFVGGCVTEPRVYAGAMTPSKPAVPFPSRDEIAKLPSLPPSVDALGSTDVAADAWAVEGAPAPSQPYDDPSVAGAFARDLQGHAGGKVTLSSPLRCAAHELGRFFIQHRGLPNDSLRRFIVARCGGEVPMVFPVAWGVTAPPSVTDDKIVARARLQMEGMVAKHLVQGESELGLALVREKGEAALVAVVAQKVADIEPGPRSVDAARKLTLRGSVGKDVAAVQGLANQGEFGVARCDLEPTVMLPKFEMTCTLAAGDSWAWVEVLGQKKGQVLQEPVADVLMYAGDGANVTYAPRSFGAPAPVGSPAQFTSALFDRLNALRTRAKLAPLALAAKQSDENARLAGTIFDATSSGDAATLDRAALGLLAGWNVEGGTIRDGHFFLGTAAPTRDVAVWLDSSIERPVGRIALLDPEARQIAVGPAVPDKAQALGAAVTTYTFFESDADHRAQERQFFESLTRARKALGVKAPERVGGIDASAPIAEVLRNEKQPTQVLRELIQTAVKRTGANVTGYVFETVDPSLIDFPAPMLRAGPLDVVVVATHHRAAEAAWGQYVIFALVVDEGATESLTAGLPAKGDKVAAASGRTGAD
jgi:hypothetical protein